MPATAMIAVHYQNEVLHANGKIRLGLAGGMEQERTRIVAKASELIFGMRKAGFPVVSVRAAYPPNFKNVAQNAPVFRNLVANAAFLDGSWGAEFHEGLGPKPGEFVVTHQRVNPFYASPLEDILQKLGTRHVIISGISTHSAVEHTARHAADVGYEVTVAEDACSSAERSLHEASLRSMSLIATIRDCAAIVSTLKAGR
jgi:biuret amidohydrolase